MTSSHPHDTFFPRAVQAQLQVLLQKRRLERVSSFPSSASHRALQIALAGHRGCLRSTMGVPEIIVLDEVV